MRTSGRSGDRGAGTVLMLAIVLAAAFLAAGAGAVGRAVVMRHQAETAADLAALAGAGAQQSGGSGCQEAARVAASNGARLTACHAADGGIVEVAVTLDRAGPGGRTGSGAAGLLAGPARSHARAGPATGSAAGPAAGPA